MCLEADKSRLHQKGMTKQPKTKTIEIGLNDQVFFEVPKGYLLTLKWLGGTTFSAKLYDLLK